MKIRLLYLITRPDLGGAQTHVLDLIREFACRYEVHLGVGCAGPLTDSVGQLGVPVHFLPSLIRSLNPWRDIRAIHECSGLIQRLQPHLVHAHSSKAGIVGRVAARRCRIPAVFTAHGWGFTAGTPIVRRLVALTAERLAAPLAQRLICVSESDRQLALRFGVGTEASLVTIRHGVPTDLAPCADPTKHPPRLIMVARFNEQKDQATLLRAIALLKGRGVKVALDFVGSGPSLSMRRTLAERLGIDENVRFLGDRNDVPQLLADAQVFVLSTHYEGLPISILEAMRAGLPVIASRVGGVPEEVEDNVTGLLVPRSDVPALAQAIFKLVDSPALRAQMGKAGRARFSAEFTQERMLRQVDAIYQEVCDGKMP
jgi:glycosyltransferase involved in cell wall biosynthesis